MNMSNQCQESIRNEIENYISYYANNLNQQEVKQIGNEIFQLIDFNNSALMHKGITWITKTYLRNNNYI